MSSFLRRVEDGRLQFKSLDFRILLGDMFELCSNESEIRWLKEGLICEVEMAVEDFEDYMEGTKNE